MATFLCRHCQKILPVSAFYPSRLTTKRGNNWCKACLGDTRPVLSAKQRNYWVASPEGLLEARYCHHCERVLPVTAFQPRPGRPRGYHSRCRACSTQMRKDHRHTNHEHNLEYYREYYNLHKEEQVQQRQANPAVRAKRYQSFRRWALANPDKHAEQHSRRRARKHGAVIRDLTASQWLSIKSLYGFRCVYCGRRPTRLTRDHMLALANGGDHTASNIVPSCQSCNSRKRLGPPHCPMLYILNIPALWHTNIVTEWFVTWLYTLL